MALKGWFSGKREGQLALAKTKSKVRQAFGFLRSGHPAGFSHFYGAIFGAATEAYGFV